MKCNNINALKKISLSLAWTTLILSQFMDVHFCFLNMKRSFDCLTFLWFDGIHSNVQTLLRIFICHLHLFKVKPAYFFSAIAPHSERCPCEADENHTQCACGSVPILKYCGITSQKTWLVLRRTLPSPAGLESALPLCIKSSEGRGRGVEAEPGSADSDTPQKISRGLHPTLPLMPESWKIE